MRKQLPVTGGLPTNPLAECREIDSGDDEADPAGEVPVDRFRELRRRREVNEPIGLVDWAPFESSSVECGPLIGREYLVRNRVSHATS